MQRNRALHICFLAQLVKARAVSPVGNLSHFRRFTLPELVNPRRKFNVDLHLDPRQSGATRTIPPYLDLQMRF